MQDRAALVRCRIVVEHRSDDREVADVDDRRARLRRAQLERAVANRRHRVHGVIERTGAGARRVRYESGVGYVRRALVPDSTAVNDRAVSIEHAGGDHQRGPNIVEDCAPRARRIAEHVRIINVQSAGVAQTAGETAGDGHVPAILNRKVGQRRRDAGGNGKHGRAVIAVDVQIVGSGPIDRHVVRDGQRRMAGKRDRLARADVEHDHIAIHRGRERIAQRTRTGIAGRAVCGRAATRIRGVVDGSVRRVRVRHDPDQENENRPEADTRVDMKRRERPFQRCKEHGVFRFGRKPRRAVNAACGPPFSADRPPNRVAMSNVANGHQQSNCENGVRVPFIKTSGNK